MKLAGGLKSTSSCFILFIKITTSKLDRTTISALADRARRHFLLERHLSIWARHWEDAHTLRVHAQRIDKLAHNAKCRRILIHWKFCMYLTTRIDYFVAIWQLWSVSWIKVQKMLTYYIHQSCHVQCHAISPISFSLDPSCLAQVTVHVFLCYFI